MERSTPRISIFVVIAGLAFLSSPAMGDQPGQDQADESPTHAREEAMPGVPLDGSIIIDESIWITLIGEPGRLMTDGYDHFLKRNLADSAESIDKASSFLSIAIRNAFKEPSDDLKSAAEALADLSRRVEAGEVKSANELKQAFSFAHLALSRHHVMKAADSLARKKWGLSGNYLRSSANHLQRAAFWSGRELRPDTTKSVNEAREEADHLVEDDKIAVEKAKRLMETLGERIKRFRERITNSAAE